MKWQFYYKAYGDPKLLGEVLFLAFKRINNYSDQYPIDVAGHGPHWGIRKILVQPLEKHKQFELVDEIFPSNAIEEYNVYDIKIQYSYPRKGKKGYATQDHYRVSIHYNPEEQILLFVFVRRRGLGRTSPMFILSLLEEKITEIAYEREEYRDVAIARLTVC